MLLYVVHILGQRYYIQHVSAQCEFNVCFHWLALVNLQTIPKMICIQTCAHRNAKRKSQSTESDKITVNYELIHILFEFFEIFIEISTLIEQNLENIWPYPNLLTNFEILTDFH